MQRREVGDSFCEELPDAVGVAAPEPADVQDDTGLAVAHSEVGQGIPVPAVNSAGVLASGRPRYSLPAGTDPKCNVPQLRLGRTDAEARGHMHENLVHHESSSRCNVVSSNSWISLHRVLHAMTSFGRPGATSALRCTSIIRHSPLVPQVQPVPPCLSLSLVACLALKI